MSQLYLIVKVSLDSDILIAADVGPVFCGLFVLFFPYFLSFKKKKKRKRKEYFVEIIS